MDYISREAALNALKQNTMHFGDRIRAVDAIRAIPAADVRGVVLCKDCYAYRKDKELARAKYLDGEKFCALLMCEMPEDGFCWYGSPNCGADMREERDD